MKDDAIWREHHELEKASRNQKRDNSNYLNNTFNKHTESV